MPAAVPPDDDFLHAAPAAGPALSPRSTTPRRRWSAIRPPSTSGKPPSSCWAPSPSSNTPSSADHDPELVELLKNLARPAVGHWWEFVRRLVPVLADAGDDGFTEVRDLVLGRARDDLPRAAGLDAALRRAPRGQGAARATVRLTELFDRLVRYRNHEIGHGAAGQRPGRFYDRMARALLAAWPRCWAGSTSWPAGG